MIEQILLFNLADLHATIMTRADGIAAPTLAGRFATTAAEMTLDHR